MLSAIVTAIWIQSGAHHFSFSLSTNKKSRFNLKKRNSTSVDQLSIYSRNIYIFSLFFPWKVRLFLQLFSLSLFCCSPSAPNQIDCWMHELVCFRHASIYLLTCSIVGISFFGRLPTPTRLLTLLGRIRAVLGKESSFFGFIHWIAKIWDEEDYRLFSVRNWEQRLLTVGRGSSRR